MDKPIIGISINEIADAGEAIHHLPISYISDGYVKAVQEVGGIPLLLPISQPADAIYYIQKIDKLILTGGQNIDPNFYHEKALIDLSKTNKKRDLFELALIREAIQQNKPIFGICRGMQLLNVFFGGTLYQEINKQKNSNICHMQAPLAKEIPTHLIYTEKGSILRKIYGKQTKVNSFHVQAIKASAAIFKVTAVSEDGVIEGIENNNSAPKLLGVQWHPDFSYTVWPQQRAIFEYVVQTF